MVARLAALGLIAWGLLVVRQQAASRGGGFVPGAGGDPWTDSDPWGLGDLGDLGLDLSAWGWTDGGITSQKDDNTVTTTEPSAPRGIRNNNPGNIEHHAANQWQGLADPPTDGRFARFVDPVYGIRAMAYLLEKYYRRDGLDYIGGIVQKWAPAHENNVAVYAGYVADKLGVRATDRIDVIERMPELIAAMIQFENGQQPYAMATINKGVALA